MTRLNREARWLSVLLVAIVAPTAVALSPRPIGQQRPTAPTIRKVADRDPSQTTHSLGIQEPWMVTQPSRGQVAFTSSKTVIDPHEDTYYIWEVRVFPAMNDPVTGELIVGQEPVFLRSSTTADFQVKKDKGGTYEVSYQLRVPSGSYKAWFFLHNGKTNNVQTGEYEEGAVRSVQFVVK